MINKTATNRELVHSLMNDFYSKVGVRKTAELKNPESGADVKKIESGAADGQTTVDLGNGNTPVDEKTKDLNKRTEVATGGATTDKAQVKDGDSKDGEHVGQIPHGASDTGTTGVSVSKTDEGEIPPALNKAASIARAARLGDRILQHVAALNAPAPMQKAAAQMAPAGQTDEAHESFLRYKAGFDYGMRKRAADEQEIIDSGVATPEQASGILDAVATEDPAVVLPEEAQPEAQLDPETIQTLDELVDTMKAENISVEQLAQSAETVGELTKAGVKPEEIIQAVAELDQEGQAKQANVRKETLKDILRGLNQ